MNVLKIIFSLLVMSNVFAGQFVCDMEQTGYKDESIVVMVSGYTVKNMTKCLKDQSKFKYYNIDIGDDYENRKAKLIEVDEFKITKYEKNQLGIVRVHFEVKSGSKKYEDSYSYNSVIDGDVSENGCYFYDKLPKNDYILKSCK